MGSFFRTLFLLACSCGGVWGSLRVLNYLARMADNGQEFHLTSEGILLVIPVCLVGAVVGALVGGMLLPRRN